MRGKQQKQVKLYCIVCSLLAGALAIVLSLSINAQAKDYAIFDGQSYNGKVYPRVDIIEWGEPSHLEFHLYSKNKPIDIAAQVIERGGKKILLINYFLKFRNEQVCRSTVAPDHFNAGDKLFTYLDSTDSDYNNIYVSNEPMKLGKASSYSMPAYTDCPEDKDDAADTSSSTDNKAQRDLASTPEDKKQDSTPATTDPDNVKPFSF